MDRAATSHRRSVSNIRRASAARGVDAAVQVDSLVHQDAQWQLVTLDLHYGWNDRRAVDRRDAALVERGAVATAGHV